MREKEREARASQPGDLSAEIVDAVGSIIRGQYDPQFGGFGREPKFPQPKILRFLLDEHRRHGYPELATMLHKTLGAMAGGGMYDHVEGGFFRYSTTRQWEVPHFEKMLEDNAELLAVFAEAHRSFPGAGYDREGGTHLLPEREPEALRVEGDRRFDVGHEVAKGGHE